VVPDRRWNAGEGIGPRERGARGRLVGHGGADVGLEHGDASRGDGPVRRPVLGPEVEARPLPWCQPRTGSKLAAINTLKPISSERMKHRMHPFPVQKLVINNAGPRCLWDPGEQRCHISRLSQIETRLTQKPRRAPLFSMDKAKQGPERQTQAHEKQTSRALRKLKSEVSICASL